MTREPRAKKVSGAEVVWYQPAVCHPFTNPQESHGTKLGAHLHGCLVLTDAVLYQHARVCGKMVIYRNASTFEEHLETLEFN